jgi:hypothetical protein
MKQINKAGWIVRGWTFLLGILFVNLLVAPTLFAQTYNGQYKGKLGVCGTTLQAFVDVVKGDVNYFSWKVVLNNPTRWIAITDKLNSNFKYFDKDGWPKRDFFWYWDLRPVDQSWPYVPKWSGVYKGSFSGQADVTNHGDMGKIENLKYNPFTNITTFDLVVPEEPEAFNVTHAMVWLYFTHTRRLPTDKEDTGITNFRLICPGYSRNTKRLFRRSYINAYKAAPFAAIRVVDLIYIENDVRWGETQTVSWKDRATPEQANAKGWPWEYVIRLCNDTNMDLWANIPVNADNNYIRGLAKLLKKELKPNLNIYIEYSNELWNWGFTQYGWNLGRADNDVKLNNRTGRLLNYDHINKEKWANYIWAQRRVGQRLKDIVNIFGEVFGRQEINKRIRGVLAGQSADPNGFFINGRLPGMLSYLQATGSTPNKWIYAVALTGYYGSASSGGAKGTEHATVSDIVNSMKASLASQVPNRKELIALAKQYGLKGGAFFYEEGPAIGVGNTTNLHNRIEAIFSPEQKNIYIENLTKDWWDLGGNLAMQYSLAANYSRYGAWGLTNDVRKLNTPLFQAVYALIGHGH